MTRIVGTPLQSVEFNAAGDEAVSARVSSDNHPRIRIDAGGRITWSSGSAAGDTNLYRDAADVLKTDDTLKVPALFIDGIEVDTSGATADQILKYNGTKFLPATGGGGGASTLDDLTDVVITSPATTQFVRYNGTNFVNATISAGDVPTLNQNTTGTAATVTGAAQTAITSVGTLTSLAVTNGVTAATFTGALTGNASTVTTNANLTGGVTSIGNAATVVTNANLTGGVTSIGNAATVVTNANLTGDVTSIGNATAIAAGVIVDADINASAGIVDTKLATIATAGKVSNSATTATSANTGNAIVTRDASGNFTAGTITAALTGNASTATNVAYSGLTGTVPTWNQSTSGTAATVTTNANLTGDVTSVGNATTLTNAPVIAKVLTGYVSGSGTVAATDSILQAVQKLNGNDALKADLASPTFTGTPTLPTGTIATTQTAADSSTKLATTAFVTTADNLKANLASPTFTGTVTIPSGASISGFALLASPTFTGTVTVPTPINSTDAVTKAYADAITQSLDIKDSVRVASTVNIAIASALTNASTIDGVVVATGDRVLLKNQTAGAENGIYVVVASGAASRSTDANTSAKVTSGMYVFVSEGTVSADMGYVLTTNDAITLDTTSLSFTQFSGAGQITAGTGLSKSGNTLSIDTTVTANLTTAQTLTNKTLTSPVINTPTGIVKGDVGLGNVDNTSNATERAAAATLTNKTLTTPNISRPVITAQGGSEGGEIKLESPVTGTSISSGVNIDLLANNLRIFEDGGTNRGMSIDITSLTASVGSTIATTNTTQTFTNKTLTSPVLTTPTLGVASATTVNKVAFTTPATGSTLTIADGKTLTASNTLTFTGTDASSVAFGAGGTVAYTDVATLSSLTSVGTLTNLTVTNAINGTLTKTVTGTNGADLIYGNMADNDQFRIRIGGTATNAGYVEIATADDGTEPIYVRQYTGVFSSLTRTATLLDGSGNTSFPGTVTATSYTGALASATTAITQTAGNSTTAVATTAFVTTADNLKANLASPTFTGTITSTGGIIELGAGRAANGYAYIDLVSETTGGTYPDYGLRLLRGDTGANAISQLLHRGTGDFQFILQEAAALIFSTTNTERMRITGAGLVGIGTSSPTEKLDVAGNIALTGSVVFEGATADGFETTLSVTDPTGSDKTITLPNASGTVALTTNVRDNMMNFIMEVI